MVANSKILCVIDDKLLEAQLSLFFSSQKHYTAQTVSSVTEGLNLLDSQSDIRLVFANRQLYNSSGLDFLNQVKEQWPDKGCFLLTEVDTSTQEKLSEAGCIDRFIAVPWLREDLLVSIRAIFRQQDLQRENEQLTGDLKKKNSELQRVNEDLEEVVAKRTEALEIRNHVLQISQGILDVLPVVVFGIDPEQLIVHCNESARDLFPYGIMGPFGVERYDVFPANINALLDRQAAEHKSQEELEYKGRKYRAIVTPVHESLAQGVVLVLIPLE